MFRIITAEEADKLGSLAWFVWRNGKIEFRTNVPPASRSLAPTNKELCQRDAEKI